MLSKINHKAIYSLWIIGFLYILPLLITNSPYYDDLGRTVYGYFSWGIDGRPLSDLIFKFLDLGSPATDIAPLPQILAIIIMSTLCYFIHAQLNPEHRLGWLVFTPIFLSPFFIQNLAFRFDSLTMSLSVATASFPLFFMGKEKVITFAASALCVFISLSLYQASLSVFIAVVCIYTLFSIKKGRDPYKILAEDIIAILGMTAGYLIYSKLIVPFFVTSDYANAYNQMISSMGDLKNNILITLDVLKSYFTGIIAFIFIIICLLATIGLTKLLIITYNSKFSSIRKFVSLLLIVASLAVILLCIPGPGLALKSMPIGPRVFVGFGFFVATLLSLISFISDRYKEKLNFIYCLLAVVSFSYMATFANAMKSQDKLADRIIYGVTNDIVTIGYNIVKTITIDGKSLYTPIASKAIEKSPLMKQIIPSYFDGPLAWGIVKMTEIYSGKEQPTPTRQNEIISDVCKMQLITDAGLYKTYFRDGDLVVSFAFRNCN
ncbi:MULTISPECIES: glucosyltransferase domain-containing protein [Escherichia]|uniref:Glucosyltransferase domain-containing protein n=1 Tax=Escherichia marmotae TaxID=1499973 RepID=A0A7L6LCN6_9ESCH|nr:MULTISPECIES: glucosyltransferase domain-containing protein [Escherichia]MEC9607530.1 glucosyltransferase domain-containing protein [Escherichia marmotae]MED0233735.1 glucosyltransferase domain-containing protein [Escherichia marmotae]MED0538854.1 glucosyltransferase domain-containing protein [Escherichia marmotae]MED8761174.1 glucosyltransferase domain-containing protein [Escherichia marmotae]MED8802483.1 glucosyltransferase domain-containing protein [Escherichia marmotae]